MNIEHVRELANILNAFNLSKLEVSDGDTKILLEKPQFAAENKAAPAERAANRQEYTAEAQTVDFNELIEVKSPIVGVFYAAPAPDALPYVSIGSAVRKGDVLCIVEAMKLLNEITAEQDGEIVDICIKNGDIAEYGQILFKMK
ncbi:MAG: acetyl-CoA carboxylase biotin carboxyl carrier protein [Clostridiales bacterium]|jgi:acetyl-CoA carboxylase biotin carboxyl carrier protein|nr:acetyl-CoA carboxylase biotin carboxyl carrier protein [Clostridiales bacterium]